jgi:hypothetical protein
MILNKTMSNAHTAGAYARQKNVRKRKKNEKKKEKKMLM